MPAGTMTVLWKTHVYRAFKIHSLPQRRLKCCSFPYPGIDKNVTEYISAEGVAEANIINSRAKYYDFLFSGTHEFSRQMCGPGIVSHDTISSNESFLAVLKDY